MKVAGDSPDAVVKKTVGHRGIEQRRDDAAVKDAVVSLQFVVRPEFGTDPVGVLSMEAKSQRPGIVVTAHQTVTVAAQGPDIYRLLSGHRNLCRAEGSPRYIR